MILTPILHHILLIHLEMHLYLSVGIMVPAETDLVISTTVKIPKAHTVHPLLCACANIRDIDSSPESPERRSVEDRSGKWCEELQQVMETKGVRCHRHCRNIDDKIEHS